MDNNLQKRINDVAQSLKRQGQTFTRSDLAYQLADEGVTDSLDLEREVYLSQQRYKFPEQLFLTNDHKHTLTEDYRLRAALSIASDNLVESIVLEHLQLSKTSINQAQRAIDAVVSEAVVNTSAKTTSLLTGTRGIEKVRTEANELYERYSQMVELYNKAKNAVSLSIEDFALVRSDVQNQFLHYANALTDVFGDSIKVISPNLFDLNQIEWLDVNEMQKQVQLDFTTITSKCGELLLTISDSFRNSLSDSSRAYQQTSDKRIGLAVAGLNMLSHYFDAHQQTLEMKGDLMRFEKSMTRDKAAISGDMLRLGTLYKTLNDVNIPKALAFRRFSEQLLQNGLQQLIESLYTSKEAKILRNEREQLIFELKQFDDLLQDLQDHVNYYSTHISESKQVLNEMKRQYDYACQSKPNKPFFLLNILTLGSAGKTYQRDLFEWSQKCMPVVQSYEELETDMKLDTEDLSKYQKEIKDNTKKYESLKQQLSNYNRQLMRLVNADNKVKAKMLRSLKDILRLLALAKEITQTQFNENLIKAVKIQDLNDIQIPAVIDQGLTTFMDNLQDRLLIDLNDVENHPQDYSKEDLQTVTDKGNEVLKKGIDIGRQMIELMKQRIDTEAARQHYNKEFQRLKEEFKGQVGLLNTKSEALLQIMSELNSSTDNESVRKALLKLSDGKLIIPSDADLQEFMKGNKQIKI